MKVSELIKVLKDLDKRIQEDYNEPEPEVCFWLGNSRGKDCVVVENITEVESFTDRNTNIGIDFIRD